MPWFVPVVVRVLAAYVAGPLLLKPIVDKYSHPRCGSSIGRDTSMQAYRQANLDILS